MKRLVSTGCADAVTTLWALSAEAQMVRRVEPRNSVNFNIGYSARGEESPRRRRRTPISRCTCSD